MKHRIPITRATVMDRAIYHWMAPQGNACLWGVAELPEALSQDLLKTSLHWLIKLVPMLSSKLERGWWRGKWTYAAPEDTDHCTIAKTATSTSEADTLLKQVLHTSIDIRQPPFFRITTIDSETVHYLVLQVHHVIVDGDGAKELFRLFAEIYRNLNHNPDWVPRPLPDMNRSWRQFMPFLKWHQYLSAPFQSLREAISVLGFLLNRNKTSGNIVGDFPGRSERLTPTNPFFETITIDAKTFQRLKDRHTRENVKINDILVASLMKTIDTWNRSRGKRHSRLATVYTANLRQWWGRPTGTFANMSVIKLLKLKAEDVQTIHKAIMTVKHHIDRAKRSFGLAEIWALMLARIQPDVTTLCVGKMMPKLATECQGITNIGIIPESTGNFGHVSASSYSLIAPPLASPSVIFTVTSYRKTLTVHGNFNAIHFTHETAIAFLSQLEHTIRELAEPVATFSATYDATDAPVTPLSPDIERQDHADAAPHPSETS